MTISGLPRLTFKMRLPIAMEKGQIYGMLYLQFERHPQQSFKATSGIAGKQYVATQFIKAVGPLPSSAIIAPVSYSVKTTALTMTVPSHRGVPMYPINPSEVKVGRTGRGDFGIHEDLNSPGTIGCIALPTEFQWALFQKAMKTISLWGISEIPLIVIYS